MDNEIVIRGAGVISAIGKSFEETRRQFSSPEHAFVRHLFDGEAEWVAPLRQEQEQFLDKIRAERNLYQNLDRAVLMAIFAARGACAAAGWKNTEEVGVVLGSSRGATATFEKQYTQFREHASGRVDATTSPTTTLGNISSAVAQDLLCEGIEFSHSVTCSTALHGMINAIAWLRAGMGKRFLVGGSEAALTDFTLAQMKALRIYTGSEDQDFPCRPLDDSRKTANTFALGEGAVVFAVEALLPDSASPALARIDGIGWGLERLTSLTSMSLGGESFVRSMKRAIATQSIPGPVDLIIGHAPGTIIGDRSERAAVAEVFGTQAPLLVSPKWQIGHTFGASGAFGMLYALSLLNGDSLYLPAYFSGVADRLPKKISRILINAAGFGGNSCSIILSRV